MTTVGSNWKWIRLTFKDDDMNTDLLSSFSETIHTVHTAESDGGYDFL